ncbi:MAG: hypothetical protein ACXACA_00035 [Candidatus Ranarchaeia archaeon]|jgi:hypothetical protein
MISEVVVMNIAGQPMFRKAYDPKASNVDPSLSSGLITAVYSFSQQVRGEAIRSMELMNAKVTFEEEQQALFVITVERRLPDRDALNIVADIRDAWFAKYGAKHLEDLGMVNTKAYEDFEPIVDRVLGKHLWWLEEGKKTSISNQFKYLSEIVGRPSRAVGAEFLNDSYYGLPILFFIASIFVSYFFGMQIVGFNVDLIWTPTIKHIIGMVTNLFILWFVLPLLSTMLNGKMKNWRGTFISTGYLFVFILLLTVVGSRVYVITIMGNPTGIDPFFPPAGSFDAFADIALNAETWVQPYPTIYTLGWYAVINLVYFPWMFLYAYVTYNIQRPSTGRHVISTLLAFILSWTFQSLVAYMLFGGTLMPH